MKNSNLSKLIPCLLFPVTSQAALVVADFNDNNVALLASATKPAQSQAGGSGWDGSWGATGTIYVVSGDLAAPAGTNYAITQSGDGRKIQGTFGALRQATRLTTTTLAATGGDIWFSLLLNQFSSASGAGISFNQNSSTSDAMSLFLVEGTEVRVGLGSLVASDPMNNPSVVIGENNLFLGRLTIDPSGDETMSLWINPDVSGGIAGLGAATATKTENVTGFNAGITKVGVISYGDGTDDGGFIDSLYISDAADANQAFAEVTGVLVPEPSTAILSSIALAGLLLRRKRD